MGTHPAPAGNLAGAAPAAEDPAPSRGDGLDRHQPQQRPFLLGTAGSGQGHPQRARSGPASSRNTTSRSTSWSMASPRSRSRNWSAGAGTSMTSCATAGATTCRWCSRTRSIFHAMERQPPLEIFEKFALLFERFEVCNGQREAWQNLLAWEWVQSLDRDRLEGYARKHDLDPFEFCADPWEKALAGGSDDHFGVLAGLTGTWLQVPGLEQRLAAGARPSELALEALRAKRMAPFGRPADEDNLSVAILDYLAQTAIHYEDPGLLRILLHKGEHRDKLWCLGIANGLAELRRHRYTLRFLKAWHACLQGEKPGVMLRLTVNKDYRPFLGHLERISKVRRKHPEALPETLKDRPAGDVPRHDAPDDAAGPQGPGPHRGAVGGGGRRPRGAVLQTQDGFELAELDLAQRGPGEFFGTRQAGLPDFRVANLLRDRELLELAKQEAARFAVDPGAEVTAEERARVRAQLKQAWQRRYGLVEAG